MKAKVNQRITIFLPEDIAVLLRDYVCWITAKKDAKPNISTTVARLVAAGMKRDRDFMAFHRQMKRLKEEDARKEI